MREHDDERYARRDDGTGNNQEHRGVEALHHGEREQCPAEQRDESGESPQSNVVELNPYSVAVKSDAYLEYETTTGVSSISNNGAPAEVYTLQSMLGKAEVLLR